MDIDNLFFNHFDYIVDYDNLIGSGSFGNVYLIEKDDEQFALKILKDDIKFNGDQQKNFIRESLILHKLKHPFVLKLKGINLKAYNDQPAIITEYLPNGSLTDYIYGKNKRAGQVLTPTEKYILLLGIADAMRYIHEQGFFHRDLKPDNILIDENTYPRIADLGLAKSFGKSIEMTIHTGTALYMAPEVECEHYGSEVDVFSYGIILYEIVTGQRPYSEISKKSYFQFLNKVKNGTRPRIPKNVFTQKMIDLMTKCWSQNPNDRPSFSDIFNQLSSDFSYFKEKIDSNKVSQFLEIIQKQREEEIKNEKDIQARKRLEQLEEENKRLRTELSQIKIKNKISEDPSNNALISEASFFSAIDSLHGPPQKRSVEKVTSLLEESSNNGNSIASYLLGILNEGGYDGFTQDPSKAMKFYEKSAEQGNSYAINRIGYCYQHGNGGVKIDLKRSIEYYRRGIELSNPFSFDNIGNSYYNGIGVEQNYSEANKYYQLGADIGYRSAMCNLANSYQKGTGVKQDSSKAIELYQRAADLGSPKAFYQLGLCYEKAKGVEQDYEKAIQMYQKAAELGLDPSYNQIGCIYFNANEFKKANGYYKNGADKGVPSCMVNLGNSYEHGLGVKQDYKEARMWYEKACEKNYAVGFYKLGLLYENGKIEGVGNAKEEEIKYYQKAADLGYKDAKLKLENLKK